METYNSKIAGNDQVELIHLSRDSTDDAAEEWAKAEKMPWPTLMKDDTDGDALFMPYFPTGRMGIPAYVMVDHQGKEVARGKTEILARLK